MSETGEGLEGASVFKKRSTEELMKRLSEGKKGKGEGESFRPGAPLAQGSKGRGEQLSEWKSNPDPVGARGWWSRVGHAGTSGSK